MKYDFGASFFFSFFILLYGIAILRPAPKSTRNGARHSAALSWNTASQPKR